MVRLAVLGCGDVAFRTYFSGLQELEDADASVVALCDPVAERAHRWASLFPGADALTTLTDLTRRSDIDGVINLTPAPLRAETTGALLAAGFHVLDVMTSADRSIQTGESIALHTTEDAARYAH